MSQTSSKPGRALGLDLGEVRIGVAISDPERRLAVPLGTVRAGAPTDLRAVAPVVLHDERLSTAEADRRLREAGADGRRRRRAVDRSAATVILQSYLDAHRDGEPGGGSLRGGRAPPDGAARTPA